MNWRRGILLAGIHLAVAVPLIVMLEVRDEGYMREARADYAPPKQSNEPPQNGTSSEGEGQTVTINPCNLWDHNPPEPEIAQFVNLPAMAISGWQQVCPPRWTLAGKLNVGYSWWPSPSTISSRREVCWGFGLLIAVQWILVGAFPLVRPKRWWREPGAFITCCAVIGFGLVLIRPIADFARIPAVLAAFAWLWWFGLLVWKCAGSVWRFISRGRAMAA